MMLLTTSESTDHFWVKVVAKIQRCRLQIDTINMPLVRTLGLSNVSSGLQSSEGRQRNAEISARQRGPLQRQGAVCDQAAQR